MQQKIHSNIQQESKLPSTKDQGQNDRITILANGKPNIRPRLSIPGKLWSWPIYTSKLEVDSKPVGECLCQGMHICMHTDSRRGRKHNDTGGPWDKRRKHKNHNQRSVGCRARVGKNKHMGKWIWPIALNSLLVRLVESFIINRKGNITGNILLQNLKYNTINFNNYYVCQMGWHSGKTG